MKRYLTCVCVSCALLAGCNSSINYVCSGDSSWCEGDVLVTCHKNEESRKTCDSGCSDNACVESCQSDGSYCDGDILVTCEDGKSSKKNCNSGCSLNKCVDDLNCDSDGAVCRDARTLQVCKNGVGSLSVCPNGCSKGACVQNISCGEDSAECDGDVLVLCRGGISSRRTCFDGCLDGECLGESECGNNTIEGKEVCDMYKLGEMTCYDVEDSDPTAAYTGQPVCNSTCDGVERGTCRTTLCGNGEIDTDMGEICDVIEGVETFLSSVVSCEDYYSETPYRTFDIEPGGMPGCSANCRGYTRGSCRLAQQSMLGLEKCQFLSFEKDETEETMTGYALVTPENGLGEMNINGKLACGHQELNETWFWGTVPARHVTCEDCESGTYKLVADFSYALKTAGQYDCVFLVDIDDGTASTEYLMCPVEYGAPMPQGMASSEFIRSYEVPQKEIDGVVLASWTFNGYQKNDMLLKINADAGVFASKSSLRMSDDSKMQMVTKDGDLSDLAASSMAFDSDLSVESDVTTHFEFSTETTGYKNIRVQFNIAGSGETTSKKVAVYSEINGVYTVVGNSMTFSGDREFASYGPVVVSNGSDKSSLKIDVYPYAFSDEYGNPAYPRIRIDDVIIFGEAM